MIHTSTLSEFTILLITVVIRLRDTNVLIYLALAITTGRGPRRGWRMRHTRHAAGTIASLKRLHLTTRDAIESVEGRLPPNQTGRCERGTLVAATAPVMRHKGARCLR
jgi:hypothetical protein